MEEQLKQLEQEALAKIEAAANLKELNDVRVAYLGKKGPITDLLKGMGKLSAEERPQRDPRVLVGPTNPELSQGLEQAHRGPQD